MTNVTSVSVPDEIMKEARKLKINCSKEAREAIKSAIEKAKKDPQPDLKE